MPSSLKTDLFNKVKKASPEWLRNLSLRYCKLSGLRELNWSSQNPYMNSEQEYSYIPQTKITLGIIKGLWNYYWPYIGACRDMQLAYKVIDISGPDWIDIINQSGCDAFVVWPASQLSIWKRMYEERLKIITYDLKKIIFPSYTELCLCESKRQMTYWLNAHNIPCPKTHVFYNIDQAMNFAKDVQLPIVFKSDFGAGAGGVIIFQNRSKLLKFVKKCFYKGFLGKKRYPLDRQWGNILFQEYITDAKEWRVIRLGDSYFGHQKLKKGQFHSGSGIVGWYEPPKNLLNFAREVTEKGGFLSMSLDIFETTDGRFLVNELQSLFGTVRPYQMLVEGKAGRYLFDSKFNSWRFEEGIFCQNGCCNLRIRTLMKILGYEIPLNTPDTKINDDDKAASIQACKMKG